MTVQQAKAQQDAIDNVFQVLFKAIGALFLHPYLCLVGFWALTFCAILSVAPWLSVVNPPTGFWDNPPEALGKVWEAAPDWYRYVALGIPIVPAVMLRKAVLILMKWVLIGGITAGLGAASLAIVEHTQEKLEQPPVSNTAPAETAPSRAERAAALQAALNEAANPEITFTPPGSDPPRELFEGVDLRVCDMSLGGVEVCQRYCATLEVTDRPGWCR